VEYDEVAAAARRTGWLVARIRRGPSQATPVGEVLHTPKKNRPRQLHTSFSLLPGEARAASKMGRPWLRIALNVIRSACRFGVLFVYLVYPLNPL